MKRLAMSGWCGWVLAACAGWGLAGSAGAETGVPVPARGATVQLTFGLKDKAATAWDGRISLSQGKVLALNSHPEKAAKVQGASWQVKTQAQKGKKGKAAAMSPVVLTADIDAPPAAVVSVSTPQGEFSFALRDAVPGKPLAFLNGQVRVEQVPFSVCLTGGPTGDDFPAGAAGSDGTVWVAFVAYQNGPAVKADEVHSNKAYDLLVPKSNGDQVRLMHFNGAAWTGPMDVTEGGLDVWRPAVAVDGAGTVWVFWSGNVQGNWDLYARPYDPKSGKWGPAQRLTDAPGTDAYVAAAANPRTGEVAVVWQGWRDGSFDILMTALSGGRAAPEKRLAQSPANEWNPSIAFDSAGLLQVAYDTYEKGNYDVRLIRGAGGDAPRTVDVAASACHEAHPNVAVDKDDRVWVAYEEAAPNWGKDQGLRWFGPKGEMLYVWREIRVVCFTGTGLLQARGVVPCENITSSYPRGVDPPRRRMSLPRLAFDPSGRLWLLFRRHPSSGGSGERWASFATYHTGEGWSEAVQVANSLNLLDNRPFVVGSAGGLLVAHSTDGRTSGASSVRTNNLYCSILRGAGDAKAVALEPRPTPSADGPPPVHPNEAEDIKRIRDFRAAIDGKNYRLLRGEFHRHTEYTSHQDMDGTVEEMWRYGLDVAGMDWIGNGDHDNGSGVEYLWWLVQKQTDLFHNPPRFCPMFSYERSVTYPSGHRNAVFIRRGIRPLPRIGGGSERLYGTPEKGSPDVQSFYAYLRHFGGICASHTSGTGMGTDWRDNDPAVEPVVEIYQGERQSYEHEGAPATARTPDDSVGGYKPAGFVWKALQKGYRLGFEVSSDHYSTHLSYTMVYAEDASREAILDALKKRHCYGANDNIILDVRCGERMMGDIFTLKGKPTLEISAVGTQPIARVSIVRGVGGEVPTYVYDGRPDKKEVKLSWTDQAPQPGQVNYYYVRIEQAPPKGGPGALAWASPMWITVQK